MFEPGPLRFLVIAAAGLVVASCGTKKKDSGTDSGPKCEKVEANAGQDMTATVLTPVSLDASLSVLCPNEHTTYSWSFDSVPIGSQLNDSNFTANNNDASVQTSFTPDLTGTYVLSLQVTSGSIKSTADLIVVDVTTSDLPPIAVCSTNTTLMVGTRVELDGSSSSDPESKTLDWSWALSTVPQGSTLGSGDLFNTGGPHPVLLTDVVGLYVVTLMVSDGQQWSAPAFCTVNASTDDQRPLADAGQGGTLPPCIDNLLYLNGYGSYDPEGTGLVYQWSMLDKPVGSTASNASFDHTDIPNPKFTWDIPGPYTFQLDVSDGGQWSAPDIVTFTVTDRANNQGPVAVAGADILIEEEATCTGSSYTAYTCDDCPATTVELDGSASVDPDGDTLRFQWSETTSTLSFATPLSSFTEVTTPAFPAALGSTSTTVYTVNLDVSDCLASSADSLTITYTCTGAR